MVIKMYAKTVHNLYLLYGIISVLLPPSNEVCEGYVFTGVCLFTGVRVACVAGGCAWQGDMHGGGGGVHGGGSMCGRGVCMVGAGVHDRGCASHAHPPGRYYGYSIWSMSGRYASYWNAFLLRN